MDARNDIIFGTCVNYTWSDISTYAMSIHQSGFRGRKILFVNNLRGNAREKLLKLGFEVIDFTPTMKNVVVERFKILHDWLTEKNKVDIRYVIHCDVRDVVVQMDPSPWMEKQTAKIFGASECIIYKDEACNPFWVEQLFGRKALETLNNEEVVCAGTIAGEADAVRRLTKRIFELSTDRFGDDQAALNILLRSEFKDEMRIPGPEEGFILTAGWWLIGAIKENRDQAVGKRSKLMVTPPELIDGVAYPSRSILPFCLVHQYERGNAWLPAIREKYNTTSGLSTKKLEAVIEKARGTVAPNTFEHFHTQMRDYIRTLQEDGNQNKVEALEDRMAELAPDIMFTCMPNTYEDEKHGGPRVKRSWVLLEYLRRS